MYNETKIRKYTRKRWHSVFRRGPSLRKRVYSSRRTFCAHFASIAPPREVDIARWPTLIVDACGEEVSRLAKKVLRNLYRRSSLPMASTPSCRKPGCGQLSKARRYLRHLRYVSTISILTRSPNFDKIWQTRDGHRSAVFTPILTIFRDFSRATK